MKAAERILRPYPRPSCFLSYASPTLVASSLSLKITRAVGVTRAKTRKYSFNLVPKCCVDLASERLAATATTFQHTADQPWRDVRHYAKKASDRFHRNTAERTPQRSTAELLERCGCCVALDEDYGNRQSRNNHTRLRRHPKQYWF